MKKHWLPVNLLTVSASCVSRRVTCYDADSLKFITFSAAFLFLSAVQNKSALPEKMAAVCVVPPPPLVLPSWPRWVCGTKADCSFSQTGQTLKSQLPETEIMKRLLTSNVSVVPHTDFKTHQGFSSLTSCQQNPQRAEKHRWASLSHFHSTDDFERFLNNYILSRNPCA